jgi:DNA-binding GntR family transcriptional regulator
VIAAAGADWKLDRLRDELGVETTVDYSRPDWPERARALTRDGKGADIVFENISSPELFGGSIAALRDYGRLVTCGSHGGGVVEVDMQVLYRRHLAILGERAASRAMVRDVCPVPDRRGGGRARGGGRPRRLRPRRPRRRSLVPRRRPERSRRSNGAVTARSRKPAAGLALEKGRRRDAVAIATERLRQLIVTGEIAPGTELSQVKLAEMAGVSTTPVREALRQLEVEGLVESRHNRRPRVPAFDPDDLDAVYCSRILLEATAISLTVPQMSAVDLAAVAEDLGAMGQAGGVEDIDAWDVAHASFHTRLVDGCGPVLRRQIRLMMSRAYRYRRMSVLGERPFGWATGEAEHESILRAAHARDPRKAATLLAVHLARSAFSVLDHLEPGGQAPAITAALRTIGVSPREIGLLTRPSDQPRPTRDGDHLSVDG